MRRLSALRFSVTAAILLPLLLAACAPATVETHSRWYWGVAAVVIVAGLCLVLGAACDAVARRATQSVHDETDEAGA